MHTEANDNSSHGRFPRLPEELEYLLNPGIYYGRNFCFDADIQQFLKNATESELDALATIAERCLLRGDYVRFDEWSRQVDDVVRRIVDEQHPYTVEISEQQRKESLELICPNVPERWREKLVREDAELEDDSPLAQRRRELRGRLTAEANDTMHHRDIAFLFHLLDACDMKFGSL